MLQVRLALKSFIIRGNLHQERSVVSLPGLRVFSVRKGDSSAGLRHPEEEEEEKKEKEKKEKECMAG